MSETPHIDIDKVADLARIALSDEEKTRFSSQLDSILGYVEKLGELDTSDVQPMAHPHSVEKTRLNEKYRNQGNDGTTSSSSIQLSRESWKIFQVMAEFVHGFEMLSEIHPSV